MIALIAAALTFFIVFVSIWKLGQPWIYWGWSHAKPFEESAARHGSRGQWSTVSTRTEAPVYHEPRSTF